MIFIVRNKVLNVPLLYSAHNLYIYYPIRAQQGVAGGEGNLPSPPTSGLPNLRNSPKWNQAPSKSGRMLGIKDLIRDILNTFEYCLPVFSFCCLKTMTSYGPQMQLFGGPLRILLAVLIQISFYFRGNTV